jgi:hypothetical protein
MKRFIKIIKNEKGQALPMALVILAMGSLFVSGFLASATSSLLSSKAYSRPVGDAYAADAGIEDAIWNLEYGSLAGEIANSGDSLTYTVPETVNGIDTEVTIVNTQAIIAADDFESYNWSGGTGWLYNWYKLGSTSIVSSQNPYQGKYQLQLRGSGSYIDRAADLADYSGLHLQFWAKVRSLEGHDAMYCLVSRNDIDWEVVWVWDSDDSDNQYHFCDIDLSTFAMSDEFWIAFDSEMNANNDYFYVDDIKIMGPATYEIISSAGGINATAVVEIIDGIPSIISWETE